MTQNLTGRCLISQTIVMKGAMYQKKLSLECFYDHFKKLRTVQSDQDGDLTEDIDCNAVTNLNFELNAVITEDEVVKAIKSLKNNKSCGTDNKYDFK